MEEKKEIKNDFPEQVKKTKEKTLVKERGSSSDLGLSSLLGLLIVFVALLCLGNNLSWWSFSLELWTFFPVIFIILGLSILGNRSIIRFLSVFIFILIMVVLSVALFFGANIYSRKSPTIDLAPTVGSGIEIYRDSIRHNSQGEYNNYFFGNLSRPEVDSKIKAILNRIYSPGNSPRPCIEVRIEKK